MANKVSLLVKLVESIATELANSIQSMDTMIEELNYLTLTHHGHQYYHKDQQCLKTNFNHLLTQCFSSYPGNPNIDSKFKVSHKLISNNAILFDLMVELKRLNEQEKGLMMKLTTFLKVVKKSQDDCDETDTDTDEDDYSSNLFAKLKI
ncbi:hypothetical protein CsatB_000468 [Cannabis sativa]